MRKFLEIPVFVCEKAVFASPRSGNFPAPETPVIFATESNDAGRPSGPNMFQSSKKQKFMNQFNQTSLLRGFTARESTAVSWLMVMDHLTGGGLRELTERYRQTREWRWKAAHLCITPACLLNGRGKEAADVERLTGITLVDLDHVEGDIEQVRALVNADPHTFLSHVTVSGEGLRVLCRYTIGPADPLPPEQAALRYAAAFLLANCHYASLTGMPFDEKCANINRLSALCHDPQAYFNPSAVPFTASADEASAPPQASAPSTPAASRPEPHSLAGRAPRSAVSATPNLTPMEYAVGVVESHGETYTPGNRHIYVMKCVAMMNRLGVSQAEARSWAMSHDLGRREVDAVVKSVYSLYAREHATYDMPRRHVSCNLASCTTPSHTRTCENVNMEVFDNFSFRFHLGHHRWPRFMQQMVDCGENDGQRDVLTLAVVVVMGYLLSRQRLLCTRYSRRLWYPVIQMFVVAPPASGKSVITWARRLADALHQRLAAEYHGRRKQYEREKAAYDNAGRSRTEMERPEEPRMKLALMPGNITASGLIELLDENDGAGLICEAEADTLSAMLNSDYGWSDILRKCFEGDIVSLYRRTDKEYREVRGPRLAVLVSGTPDQVHPLVSSAGNGQFSRALYLTMPQQDAFVNQFDLEATDVEARFSAWGEEWLRTVDSLASRYGRLELRLTPLQQAGFNSVLSRIYHHAAGTQARGYMKSSVARESINLLRIASVVALLRALETGQGIDPDPDIPAENVKDGICSRHILSVTDADLSALLAMADPLYRNACGILTLLPETAAERRSLSPAEALVQSLPLTFTRTEAVAMAERQGVSPATLDSMLSRMVGRGQLLKTGRGSYEFNPAVS